MFSCTSVQVIGDKDHKAKATAFECVWLLNKLQKLCSGLNTTNSNVYVATFSAMKAFYTMKQRDNKTLEAYHKRFEAVVDTTGMSLGDIFVMGRKVFSDHIHARC